MKKKRILAGILAAILLVNSGVGAFAETTQTTTQTETTVQTADTTEQENKQETEITTADSDTLTADAEEDDASESEDATVQVDDTVASYPWENLDDEAFCAWIKDSDNAVHIIDVLTESGEEYEALMDRLDAIEDTDILAEVHERLGELTGTEEIALTDDEEAADTELSLLQEDAFQKIFREVFGSDASLADTSIIYVANESESEVTAAEGTADNPCTSLSRAYSKLGSEGGILCLRSDYTSVKGNDMKGFRTDEDSSLDNGWLSGKKPVIIVAEDASTALAMKTDWKFGSSVGLYHVSIQVETGETAPRIYASGNTAVFGGEGEDNLSVQLADGSKYYPALCGGASSGTVENTNVIINGGTWDRCFGALGGTYVSGTAKTTINGRVNGDDGSAISGKCSVTFTDGNQDAYDKVIVAGDKNADHGQTKSSVPIIGGVALINGSAVGQVQNVDLSISYLNYGGTSYLYDVNMNGGNVGSEDEDGEIRFTADHSTLSRVGKGEGHDYGDLYVTIQDKCDINQVNLTPNSMYDYHTMYVTCRSSKISNYYGKQFTYGSSSANVYEVIDMKDCTLDYMYIGPYYAGYDSSHDSLTLDSCTFLTKATGIVTAYNGYPITLKNMTQEMVFGETSRATETTVSYRSWIYDFGRTGETLTLENSKARFVSGVSTVSRVSVDANSTLTANSLTINEISGTGAFLLSDGANATIGVAAAGTALKFGVYGDLTSRCSISGKFASKNGEEFAFANLPDGAYSLKLPGSSMSFWYISADEITYDRSKLLYVDSINGSDDNKGYFDSPFRTLEQAYAAADGTRNQIVLMSAYTAPSTMPSFSNDEATRISITANDGLNDFRSLAKLTLPQKTYVNTDTVFENLQIDGSNTNLNLQGHSLTVGSNVSQSGCSIYGTTGNSDDQDKTYAGVNIAIASGEWTIYDGYGTIDGDVTIQSTTTTEHDYVHLNRSKKINGNLTIQASAMRKISVSGEIMGTTDIDIDKLYNYDTQILMLAGTFHGAVNVVLDKLQANDISRYLGISGTYEDGATISTPSDTTNGCGIYLGSSNLTVKNKPMDIYYRTSNESAIVGYCAQSTYELEEAVTVHCSGMQSTIKALGAFTSWSNNNTKITRDSDPIPNLNVEFDYTQKQGDPQYLYVADFYGFSNLTVKGNAVVTMQSAMELDDVTVSEGAKLVANKQTDLTGNLVIGEKAELECGAELHVAGGLRGTTDSSLATTGVLALNGEANGNNEINGAVTGYTALYTKQTYQDDTLCQTLGIQSLYADHFVPAYELEHTKTTITICDGSGAGHTDDHADTLCFGAKNDYSVIYVDADAGDDKTNSGITPDSPVQTLEKAYDLVRSNGKIVLCSSMEVSEWVHETYKKVEITSYDGTTDYRTNGKNAKLILTSNSYTLHSDTIFGCVAMELKKETAIYAYDCAVQFGIAPDEMKAIQKADPTVANFSNTNKLNVHGSQKQTEELTDTIAIHEGTFNKVLYRHTGTEYDQTGEYIYQVTMTGGTVSVLSADEGYNSLSGRRGIAKLYLSGGTVETLGRDNTYDYNGGSGCAEEYYISDDFQCTVFKPGTSYDFGYSSAQVSVEFKNLTHTIPTVYLSFSKDRASCSPLTIYVENSTIDVMKGGSNVNSGSQLKASAVITLGKNATVNNIYAGNDGTVEVLNSVQIDITDPTASIGALYRNGAAGQLPAANVTVNYRFDEKSETAAVVDYLQGEVDAITVDENSYVKLLSSQAGMVNGLQIAGGGKVKLEKGCALAGGLTGSDTADTPAILELPNAATIQFSGTVSGCTELQPATNFTNGITVRAANSGDGAEAYITCAQENGELQYSADDTSSVWSMTDSENGAIQTTVYTDKNDGTENGSGTYMDPVNDLAHAYRKADELYRRTLALTDDEIQALSESEQENVKTIKESGMKIVLEGDTQLGDFTDLLNDAKLSKVTIQAAKGSNAAITFVKGDSSFAVPIDTVLTDVSLKDSSSNEIPMIYAQGNRVEVTSSVTTSSSRFCIYGGSDSDAVTDGTTLTVNGGSWDDIFGGGNLGTVDGNAALTIGGSAQANNVYGGGSNKEAAVTGNVTTTIAGGTYANVYGGGENASVLGNSTVVFRYGEIENLYGGGYEETAYTNHTYITIGTAIEAESRQAVIRSTFRGSGLRGPLAEGGSTNITIYGNAAIGTENSTVNFCAGGYSGSVDETNLTINGGVIYADVYGGGWGEGTPGAFGNAGTTNVQINGGTINGDVYGGGKLALVTDQASVTFTDGSITGNIYGGGNAAGVAQSEVTIAMGTDAALGGNVFGGSCNITDEVGQIQVGSAVTLESGTISGAVFGGSDTSGLVLERAEVNVTGTVTAAGGVFGGGSKAPLEIQPMVTVAKDAVLTGNVYGGGKGEAKNGIVAKAKSLARALVSLVSGSDDTFDTGNLTDANVPKTNVTVSGTVNGNVYGGGEYATVGSSDSDTWNTTVTNVTVEEGAKINGNLYGGGKGEDGKDYAVVYGNTSVVFRGGTLQAVDANGAVTDSEDEDNGAAFGGGEIAPVAGGTNVTVHGGTISNLFGGNDTSGTVCGGSQVTTALGSTAEIAHLYGGGRDADIASASVTIRSGTIGIAYAGGNAATVTDSAQLTVNTTDKQDGAFIRHVDTVFAGNNQAEMDIQPTLTLTSGKIGTVYCGGNAGIMTAKSVSEKQLTYAFDYPNIEVENVFAGCNATGDANTADVTLTLIAGTYGNVYGGNNTSGQMAKTNVVIDNTLTEACSEHGKTEHTLCIENVYGGGFEAQSPKTSVELVHYSKAKGDKGKLNIYGGGNKALVESAAVQLTGGWADTVYGGGNAATVEAVAIASDDNGTAEIEKLFCGNNAAEMDIQPDITGLAAVQIGEFYGGGNKGKMITESLTSKERSTNGSLLYTFANPLTKIDTVYGGCNQADVEGKVVLNVEGASLGTVYGGCNTSGTMTEADVNIRGDVDTVYGGGCGENTSTTTTNVAVQNGTVSGSVYGGSGLGYVDNANVTVKEAEDIENARIVVKKNVFGAGFGESSVARQTNVTVDMALNIDLTKPGTNCDLLITAVEDETTEEYNTSSGETRAISSWQSGRQDAVSVIEGDVYGGGDMGKVGDGTINTSSNTADTVSVDGTTAVQIQNGYIRGSVFGGGNGVPTDTSYTVNMGTVFGSCHTQMTGGYVSGSIYGCGNQSRTYATGAAAAELTIKEEPDDTDSTQGRPIVIGTSIFGGGNKGDGATVNASVYTVVGSTTVNINGMESAEHPTAIYLLSENKGGVYGDGNLCLVNGTRTVNINNFNRGAENLNQQLKTFYSLQRADEVNLTNTRIVLEGAEDLVDANAGTTLYSINRVGQLNMMQNSAIKLTTVVNLLGGLSSDCNVDTTYINKGNNGKNNYTKRGGQQENGEIITKAREEAYQTAYKEFLNSKGQTTPTDKNLDNVSFNVVCVANGQYLEVKQSDTQYGNVNGLFILQLLHAEAGVGGGFVYANIGEQDEKNDIDKGSTGDFVCVTQKSEDSDDYMQVEDNVGGYDEDSDDYTYYYWYIKGGNMKYTVNLNGYIGTSDTEFTESVMLPTVALDSDGKTLKRTDYVLGSIEGEEPASGANVSDNFNSDRLVSTWDSSDTAYTEGDRYAIEVKASAVVQENGATAVKEQSLGYLAWDNDEQAWRLDTDDGRKLYGTGDDNNIGETGDAEETENIVKRNIVCTVDKDTQLESLHLKFVLHKGTGVSVEIKNVLNTITLYVKEDYDAVSGEDTSELVIKNYTSITRIVPTQAVYMSSGRQYAGVASESPVTITQNSAFTVQYITRYVPSAFSKDVKEKLTLNVNETYLWSKSTGVGFTVVEDDSGIQLTAVTDGSMDTYRNRITKENGNYVLRTTKENGDVSTETLENLGTETSPNTYFPKGTTITLVAQIDDCAQTYWYYYCTEDQTGDIPLSEFVQMNEKAESTDTYTLTKASGGRVSSSTSNRITENLIFIVDFANVSLSDDDDVSGRLQLKHSYLNGVETRDIMDYLTEETTTENGVSVTSYKRVSPAVSNLFQVEPTKSGISDFTLDVSSSSDASTDSASSGTVCYEQDVLTAELKITPDKNVMNTQYDEREYAVLLSLEKRDEQSDSGYTAQAFPEGTIFLFDGKQLQTNANNESVIVPVKNAGTHTVQIQTALSGFESGEYRLNAVLYSASEANYYNNLPTTETAQDTFAVVASPTCALSVTAGGTGASRIVSVGESLDITVKASRTAGTSASGAVSDTDSTFRSSDVGVTLYQYQKSTGKYKRVDTATVFDSGASTVTAVSRGANWKPVIRKGAASGTYRLAFTYGDKCEYLDFMVS